ncbi:hypothetical protein JCM3774_003280 [Rhodotorula dairenensis]
MPGQARRLRPIEPVLTSAWHRVEVLPHRELLTEEERAEWESEDEVEYVTLEFGSHLPEEVLNQYGELQLLGADAPHPVARVGHKHFQGVHETLIGNDILFKHQPEATPCYVPFAKSSHRITFQPVHIVHDPNKAATTADTAQASLLPGRPRGSKNKNPLRQRARPADAPREHDESHDILDENSGGVVATTQRAGSEVDEVMLEAKMDQEERPNAPAGDLPGNQTDDDDDDDLYE